jgi:ankyrin repeat protein
LLDAGANIEAVTTWGATPLAWAATMGSASVAELLLERGASGFTIIVAAGLGKFDEVKKFVDSAHIQNDVLSDSMYAAARNGHTEVVEYLLDHGATIDTKGIFGATGLHWAAINGHRKTVELLVTRGASIDIRDERFDSTPEGWAIEGGHTDIAELLSAQNPE